MTTRSHPGLDTIWFTRCAGGGRGGVPTASGIAYKLGFFEEEFGGEGLSFKTLQEDGGPELRRHHYDHELGNLIREGGNLFAIPAKAQGAQTKLVGLTWIDEAQSILVRPDSDIRSPADLKGKRLGLPVLRAVDVAENKRGRSITRYGSLAGYEGALASAGLSLGDVTLVEFGDPRVDERSAADANFGGFGQGFAPLLERRIDAFYVKGAGAQDGARHHGVDVGIDLDRLPEKRFRVNNGLPRPITVHTDFLRDHHDLLVRFLYQTLRAAEWAKSNLTGVSEILQSETGATAHGVAAAYRHGFHLALAPDLSDERLELFRQQKQFQLAHGVFERDFDFDAWIERGPLAEAQRRLGSLRAVA